MTMEHPVEGDAKTIQHCFSCTREIFEEMKWEKIGGTSSRHLSMGMSHDFEVRHHGRGRRWSASAPFFFGGKTQDHEEEVKPLPDSAAIQCWRIPSHESP